MVVCVCACTQKPPRRCVCVYVCVCVCECVCAHTPACGWILSLRSLAHKQSPLAVFVPPFGSPGPPLQRSECASVHGLLMCQVP